VDVSRAAGKLCCPEKALCPQTLASAGLFQIADGLEEMQKRSPPAPLYPPTGGRSTWLLLESSVKPPPLTPLFPRGFSQEKRKPAFSMFNLQRTVSTLRRGKEKNALVHESLEGYILFHCSATRPAG